MQAVKAVLSKAHWKLAPFSEAVKASVAEVARIVAAGPDVMVVSGPSTEKVRSA